MRKKKDTFIGNCYGLMAGVGLACVFLGGYMVFGLIALVVIWLAGLFNEDE